MPNTLHTMILCMATICVLNCTMIMAVYTLWHTLTGDILYIVLLYNILQQKAGISFILCYWCLEVMVFCSTFKARRTRFYNNDRYFKVCVNKTYFIYTYIYVYQWLEHWRNKKLFIIDIFNDVEISVIWRWMYHKYA